MAAYVVIKGKESDLAPYHLSSSFIAVFILHALSFISSLGENTQVYHKDNIYAGLGHHKTQMLVTEKLYQAAWQTRTCLRILSLTERQDVTC